MPSKDPEFVEFILYSGEVKTVSSKRPPTLCLFTQELVPFLLSGYGEMKINDYTKRFWMWYTALIQHSCWRQMDGSL